MQEVTVLIPTYRPDKKLGEILRRLSLQSHVPERVLILNTSDRDGDARVSEVVDACAQMLPSLSVMHVEKKDFDHGGTRHLGFTFSHTPLVLCMTQDALPRDRYLVERLEKAFDDPQVAAAYGRQLATRLSGPIERYTREFNYPEKASVRSKKDLGTLGIKTFFCSDVCAMWRREIYMQMGGFERHTIFNEDMILAGRMVQEDYKIAYVPEAAVWHSHNYSAKRQLKRNFDLGVSQAQHPEIFAAYPSEGEGVRLVISTMKWLAGNGRAEQIPKLVVHSGCKYIGYRLGRSYAKLPRKLVMALTDNRSYWNK